MSDDIAEFLRRAAQRYPHAQRPMQPIVIEAEVVEDAEILDTGDTPGQDVVQHVQQHMDTSGFSRRASLARRWPCPPTSVRWIRRS